MQDNKTDPPRLAMLDTPPCPRLNRGQGGAGGGYAIMSKRHI
jgi:hypothetical protein